jgi:hypothetical protein
MITIKIELPHIEEKLKTFMKGGEGYDSVIRGVATSMKGVIQKRIHEEGKAADGGNIGQYDTTHPLYVNPRKSPKQFTPMGKTGKTKFENGQPHKTKYFNSYKGFREEIGRPTDTVNLSLTGQMNSQFTIIPTSDGYGLGWNNTEMYKRSQGLEMKYNKVIWGLTDEEQKQAVEVANFEVGKIIDKSFGNYNY